MIRNYQMQSCFGFGSIRVSIKSDQLLPQTLTACTIGIFYILASFLSGGRVAVWQIIISASAAVLLEMAGQLTRANGPSSGTELIILSLTAQITTELYSYGFSAIVVWDAIGARIVGQSLVHCIWWWWPCGIRVSNGGLWAGLSGMS